MAVVTLEIPEHLVSMVESQGEQLSLILEMGASRLAPVSSRAYSEVVEFLTKSPSTEEIADFRYSEEVEARISVLLEKNKDDELSKADEVELERLSELEERMQLLKADAFVKMSGV